ncbi:hypothetical protein FXO38_20723 [Capsicum annuum]|uniref:Protein kinase domain-containing protein n=1 Tax=Capsicum annuum TaxID=4072 RepID=A0A2G2Z988_CAPAN|nr:hypothetical protein FXO37_34768 [Capsicum annuum]KAF3643246.1 hypothetical protein FXO38_20723 [Capsicum annuum]PHT78529.1 hypothetical protein T459_16581 [Capsicum annuum]
MNYCVPVLIFAYGDTTKISAFVQQALNSTGIGLDHVPAGLLGMSGVSARGLLYQHGQCDPKIIHRDVKAANILLDDDCEAVVGDFGLAKLLDHRDSHIATAVRGTVGHIAPEYLSTGQSSDKTDVFGFGILLLELISGQRAVEFGKAANQKGVMLDWGSRSDIFSQLDRACLLGQNALELVILFYFSDGILNPLGLTADSYFEFCCCRDEKSQLLLGLKRANHQQTSLPSSVLSADNIREIAKEGCGLISLQENLLSDLLKKDKIDLSDIDRGVSMIKECLVHKKFLVLDDVDDLNQLKGYLIQEIGFLQGVNYEALSDDHDKNVFLDIACFFVGKDKDCTIKVLDDCGFHAAAEIRNLIDISWQRLLTTS